jgi:flagellar protein FlgJ
VKVDAAHSPASTVPPKDEMAMRMAAEGLEATFIGEMLKPMGADHARSAFGGGIGEEQFSSFLLQEEAHAMVRAGGIGLAESIFQAMKKGYEASNEQP